MLLVINNRTIIQWIQSSQQSSTGTGGMQISITMPVAMTVKFGLCNVNESKGDKWYSQVLTWNTTQVIVHGYTVEISGYIKNPRVLLIGKY